MQSLFSRVTSLATRLFIPSRAAMLTAVGAFGAAGLSVGMAGQPGVVVADASERSFLMIKPDGVQRGLIAAIFARFERKGYKLVGLKMLTPSLQLAERHYADLREKPFYPRLTKFLASGPVVAMVWEGHGVVQGGRALLGTTDPKDSAPGSIRGDFAIVIGKNIIHGSDSAESAEREIAMWFAPDELNRWISVDDPWIYE